MNLVNDALAAAFEERTGTLASILNMGTGQSFSVSGDDFVLDLPERLIHRENCRLTSLQADQRSLQVVYDHDDLQITVMYRLAGNLHFLEKTLSLTSKVDCGLRKVTISQPRYQIPEGMTLFAYRYQKNVTFFGRTSKGGLFTGIETADGTSWSDGRVVCLCYCPNLKVSGGQTLACESMYVGVYQKPDQEGDVQISTEDRDGKPLPSESEAMIAMTSALLEQPREDLVTLPIIWNCRLAHQEKLKSRTELEEDRRVFEYLKDCGFVWTQEFNTWGGEFAKLNALREGEEFDYDPLQKHLLEHGRQNGFRMTLWATMTNAHPWRGGKPFRPDRPEWLTTPVRFRFAHAAHNAPDEDAKTWRQVQGNCMGNTPFVDWLESILRERLESGLYDGFSLDGDFVGAGGLTALGCRCEHESHDHLPGDAHYACQRSAARMLQRLRRDYPDCYIWLMRPMMDLGVWSSRHASCVFTIDEFSKIEGLPRLKDQPTNVVCGDKIRLWSRIRLHRHFLPHYLDQPLVFPYTGSRVPGAVPWSGEKIDYIMLSALSCSPNQAYYLPPAEEMPAEDRQEIRRWLDWGRAHLKFLFVRKDLPGWPRANHVDGSAHLIDGDGFLFLFNPNRGTTRVSFDLTRECIGLTLEGEFRLSQHYPESPLVQTLSFGDKVTWTVDGESAVILELRKQSKAGTTTSERP